MVVIFTRLTTRLSERLFGLGPALAIGPRQWPHRTEFAQCKQIASPSDDLRHNRKIAPRRCHAVPSRRWIAFLSRPWQCLAHINLWFLSQTGSSSHRH